MFDANLNKTLMRGNGDGPETPPTPLPIANSGTVEIFNIDTSLECVILHVVLRNRVLSDAIRRAVGCGTELHLPQFAIILQPSLS